MFDTEVYSIEEYGAEELTVYQGVAIETSQGISRSQNAVVIMLDKSKIVFIGVTDEERVKALNIYKKISGLQTTQK